MTNEKNSQETFRDYLLGRLAGDDQEEFEKRLLIEDDDFEDLLASAEDELIDQYVGGHLNKEQREAFEKHYLITIERQEEMEFARTLSRFIKQKTPSRSVPGGPARNQIQTWLLRAAAVVTISLVALYAYFMPRTQFATVTLTASVNTRADGAQSTKVNLLDADALRIVLKLPEQFPRAASYRAELENDNGDTKPVKVTGQNSQEVTVEIPANELKREQYALKLFAIDAGGKEQRIPGSYFFSIE